MRVLILGASGMLGHALLHVLSTTPDLEVTGVSRARVPFLEAPNATLISGVNALNSDDLIRAFAEARPDVVINAVGLIKQLEAASNPLITVPVNTLLPFRLADLCLATQARLIHISTDCVFQGDRSGMYTETDRADALDLYGLSKYLGEVADREHVVTLRTSIIGRERRSANGLIEWFLSAPGPVKGFRRAVFSGLPTVVLAEIIRDLVIPDIGLRGLYHLSGDPINKYDLLLQTASTYNLDKVIEPQEEPRIDRSLDSERFRTATGYRPEPWPDMLEKMRVLQG